jgi:hypothetical protein
MFKIGDKVQFSKFGARGLIGFVREVQPGRIRVQWNPREWDWVRSSDLVKLEGDTRNWRGGCVSELLKVAKEVLS